MTDFLLQLGGNPVARKVIKGLRLPIPTPQALRRAKGPWNARPLDGRRVIIGGTGAHAGLLRSTATDAGAIEQAPSADAGARVDALVFDASGVNAPAGLRALYDFFHPQVARLAANGRVLVVGTTPAKTDSPAQAAAQQALDGFVRSVARELGKRGATANLVYVDPGAEAHLEGTARFLLSDRAAFVSGQPLHLSAGLAAPRSSPRWEASLSGKVALVTGAARGIGAATAKLLAGEGAHVVCLDRPADGELAGQVARELGGSVLLADVGADDAPAKIAAELEARHGGVDIVVHNAGITRDKTLARMKPEQWDQAVGINLGAVARITDALVERGLVREGGRIICLSSVAGVAGNLGQTNYSASKAGVIGLVRALAPTLAKRGLTINAIAPGFIETRMTGAIPLMIREAGRRLSNLGQGGQPQDVGELVTFLATPFSSGLNGQVIRVCGGAYVGA